MRTLTKLAAALASTAALAVAPLAAKAQGPGVSDDEILICSYQPMTGSVSSYFRMGRGADAWFKYLNEEHGGVHGRKINFRMVDDQYEPARTRTIVRRFIERDNCFAIVSPLGSAPTAAVIDYIAVDKDVPLIGAGTGADQTIYHASRNVFPLYPAYDFEGEEMVRFAKEVLGGKRIGVIYQNDPSGQSHMVGIRRVLEQHGVELGGAEGYEPREVDLSSQVVSLRNAGIDALICSCAPEPAAKVYTERARLGWDVPTVNVFFGKSPKVPELAGDAAVEGVYFSSIFPDWKDPDPNIQLAREILEKYYPRETPDEVHLWGFAGAQVFTEALRRMGRDDITRERLVDTLESMQGWRDSVIPEVNIGQMKEGEDNSAVHLLVSAMSWTIYEDGDFRPFVPPWME